ncbi:trypsin-like peptidase domain-containing protein [Streptomyces sp. NPDC020965]|uniref:effector-associated domain 2-containing protein n=1 Tax=Streptomyces sp. NPDC020965 TaxID=3365105 RepID=UPI00378CF37A
MLTAGGGVLGAGVYVAPGHVLTCAHVVAAALGAAGGRTPAAPPPGAVFLGAPGSPDAAPVKAVVVDGGWFPGPLDGGRSVDLAVLRFSGPPPGGVVPAVLAASGEPDGRELSVYGHPVAAPAGIWSVVRAVGWGGPHHEWVQLAGTGPTGAGIERGFSGAGVWDPVARGIVGLVTAAYRERGAKVAWMLPLEVAGGLWAPLAGLLAAGPTDGATARTAGAGTPTRAATIEATVGAGAEPLTRASEPATIEAAAIGAGAEPPTRAAATAVGAEAVAEPPTGAAVTEAGAPTTRTTPAAPTTEAPTTAATPAAPTTGAAEPPSDTDQFAIADALLRIAAVEDDSAATLRRLLPPAIRHNVRTHPRARLQTYYLVQACADHRQGREALTEALRLVDDSSEPARAALALLDRVWPLATGGDAG